MLKLFWKRSLLIQTITNCYTNTNGVGMDGILITAETNSNGPIDLAAQSSRKKGRIILIGAVGLQLKRDYFYKPKILQTN